MRNIYLRSKTRSKPGVWYGFHKPALVPANDVILMATPCLSKDCVNSETWSRSRLSASQLMFSDYGPRLRSVRMLHVSAQPGLEEVLRSVRMPHVSAHPVLQEVLRSVRMPRVH